MVQFILEAISIFVLHICIFDTKVQTFYKQFQTLIIEFVMFNILVECLKHIITDLELIEVFCNSIIVVLYVLMLNFNFFNKLIRKHIIKLYIYNSVVDRVICDVMIQYRFEAI